MLFKSAPSAEIFTPNRLGKPMFKPPFPHLSSIYTPARGRSATCTLNHRKNDRCCLAKLIWR
jgi:hypothetical protein